MEFKSFLGGHKLLSADILRKTNKDYYMLGVLEDA